MHALNPLRSDRRLAAARARDPGSFAAEMIGTLAGLNREISRAPARVG
jgi:hypothetical protein